MRRSVSQGSLTEKEDAAIVRSIPTHQVEQAAHCAYEVEAWPTLFLLDKQGRVRWTHVGAGYYDETQEVIKKLLSE